MSTQLGTMEELPLDYRQSVRTRTRHAALAADAQGAAARHAAAA